MIGDFGMKGGRLPAPEELILKVGAQVMFVKNDSDGRWVNGTIGIVEKLTSDLISVSIGDVVKARITQQETEVDSLKAYVSGTA